MALKFMFLRKKTIVLAAPVVLASLAYAASGGPGGGGYTYADSDELDGPSHTLFEIDGEDLGLGDEDTGLIDLPFDIDWYGSSESQLIVGDNATAFFQGSQASTSTACPGTSGNWSGVAAFWQDLETDTVQWGTVGQYPYRMLVIDWKGIHPDGIPGDGRVQAWFLEFTSEVGIAYEDVDFGDVLYDGGASAVTGIQANSANGLAYTCIGGITSNTTSVFSSSTARRDATTKDITALPLYWYGDQNYDYIGNSLESDDLNGDSLSDLVIGGSNNSEVHIFYGGASLNQGLASLSDVVISGSTNTSFGAALATGDLNGDGVVDLVVGSPLSDDSASDSGTVYIFSSDQLSATNSAPTDSISYYTGPTSSSKARAGTSIYIPGDIDNDGYDDLLIGAPYDDTSGTDAGAVYLIYGQATLPASDSITNNVSFLGEALNDHFGETVAGGDIDGDGAAEFLIGAPQNDFVGTDAGRAYLFASGSYSGSYDGSLTATATFEGEAALDRFGDSALIMDFDQDGTGDILLGAPRNSSSLSTAGAVYAFLDGTAWTGSNTALNANTIMSGDASSQLAGTSIDSVDIDQDGLNELAIGGPGASTGAPGGGAVWVVTTPPTTANYSLADADYRIDGAIPGAATGSALASMNDIQGDGLGDIAIGTYLASVEGLTNNGLVSVWSYTPAWLDDDSDGVLARSVGGADCNDSDATISPALSEDTGLDSGGYAQDADCDGWVNGAVQVRNRSDWWEYDVLADLGSSQTEDFDYESGTDGDIANSLYTSNGVTISSSSNLTISSDVYGSAPAGTLGVRVGSTGLNEITFEFDESIDAMSLQLLDTVEPIGLIAIDADGNSLLTPEVRLEHDGDNLPSGRTIGVTFAESVYSVTLTNSDINDGWGFDDLEIAWSYNSDRDGDGYTGANGDCDDKDYDVNPGVVEDLGNGIDDDCDGTVDGGVSTVWDNEADWLADTSTLTIQIVDFEDPATGTILSTEYEEVGVDFSSDLEVSTDIDGSSPVDLQAAEATTTTISILFEEEQPAVAFNLIDGSGNFTVEAYQQGMVIYSTSVTGGSNNTPEGEFVGLTYDYSVDEIKITGPSSDIWGIDNLQFSELGLDDADGDGFFEPDDCDDNDPSINSLAMEIWYDGVDQNCDEASDYDADGDGSLSDSYGGTDCDDNDSSISPNALEVWYDGVDQDCDSGSDYDADGDGFESDSYGGTDCDDSSSTISPNTTETYYDGLDDNCDPTDDDDADGDGYSAIGYPSGAFGIGDCDDLDSSVSPGAVEVFYDGVDSDCDGASDYDSDLDGYDSDTYGGDDCDDALFFVNPGITSDSCYDGIDSDCDGASDYDCDLDGFDSDSYGGTDCDDTDASINTDATESDPLDGIDEDCDGSDEWDADGDGYQGTGWGGLDCDDLDANINPGAIETCYDGIDSNCSNHSDDDCDEDGYEMTSAGGLDCDDLSEIIFPGAPDSCYDAVDSACDGDLYEFDCDQDGYDSDAWGGLDCDDDSDAISPSATDIPYDGTDQDCSGTSDFDADLDGYESDAYGGADCDDTDTTVNPGAVEIWYDGVDQDCDQTSDYDQDLDGDDSDAHGGDDCNDADATIYVGATDSCYDGVDSSCDGDTYEFDCDQDGYDSDGYSGTDCDDDDANINPSAIDFNYDGIDSDCSNSSDYDADGDGFEVDFYGGDDCDDNDASININASEIWYDGVDSDCNGGSDYDADGDEEDSDLYGGLDCDDTNADVNTSATEIAHDGIDQNCDGADLTDEDGDGYDSITSGGSDCDDTDSDINPGAIEIWYDGIDQDCDLSSDYDQDGDGYESDAHSGLDCDDTDSSVNPSEAERWYDGKDGDCSGGSDFDQDGDGHDHTNWGGGDCDDTNVDMHPDIPVDDCGGGDEDCDTEEDEDCVEETGDTDTGDTDTDTGDTDTGDTDTDTDTGDTDTGDTETGDTDTGDTDTGETDTDTDPDTDTDTGEDDTKPTGCGCNTTPTSGPLSTALLFFAMFVTMRRRIAPLRVVLLNVVDEQT